MDPTPKPAGNKKKRQQQLLIAGGALVVLFVLFSRGRAAAAPAVPAVDPNAQNTLDPAGGMPPSTFADNGASAAALGNQVSDGLSGVSQALGDQGTAFQNLADSISGTGGIPRPNGSPGVVVNVGQPAGGTKTGGNKPAKGSLVPGHWRGHSDRWHPKHRTPHTAKNGWVPARRVR